MTQRLLKALLFIRENYSNCQVYTTRNNVGDPMETVYSKDGITIDECTMYNYIEVFGLNTAERFELKNLTKAFNVFDVTKFDKMFPK